MEKPVNRPRGIKELASIAFSLSSSFIKHSDGLSLCLRPCAGSSFSFETFPFLLTQGENEAKDMTKPRVLH